MLCNIYIYLMLCSTSDYNLFVKSTLGINIGAWMLNGISYATQILCLWSEWFRFYGYGSPAPTYEHQRGWSGPGSEWTIVLVAGRLVCRGRGRRGTPACLLGVDRSQTAANCSLVWHMSTDKALAARICAVSRRNPLRLYITQVPNIRLSIGSGRRSQIVNL